jgi:O-antigen/teichoic acid export membrane protein
MLKNLFSFSAVGLLPYLINFFVLPLYSNYITPDEFGIVGLLMSAVIIASSWTGLQFSSALSRYFFDYEGDELKVFTSTVLISVITISLLFCTLYSALIYFGLFLHFFEGISTGVMYISVFLIFLSILNTVFERLLINEQLGHVVLIRSVFSQLLSVSVGSYLIIYCGLSYVGFLISNVIYYSCLVLFSLKYCRKYFVNRYSFYYAGLATKYSVPLILHALGGVLFMYSTTFFIESFLTLSLVGLFFIIDKFTQILKAIVNSINNVLMPIYNKRSKVKPGGGVEFIESILPVWFLFITILIINFSAVAQSFLLVYMGKEYEDLVVLILILSSAYLFRGLYCFCMAPIFFHKRTQLVPKITITTGVLSLPINYLLVSRFGFTGAGLAVFTVFLVNFLLSLLASKKVELINFKFKSLILMTAVVIAFNSPVFFLVNAGFITVLSICLMQILVTVSIVYRFNLFDIREGLSSLRINK